MSLTHVHANDPIESITEPLLRDGGVIVEGMLDVDQLAEFNAELDPILDSVAPNREFLNPAVDFFFGKKTRHLTGMATRSKFFATEVLPHPTYMKLCDAILGPSCANYQLNVAQVLDRGPGAEAQLLHRDEDVWVHLPRPHPEIQVASVMALVDFTEEIGATQLVPGSHRWERERIPEEREVVSAEMPAGSAVFYLGSTIHRGGTNTTESAWRRGMHLSYTVGWLRTEENNYLATPPEVARELPPRTQELLGYAAHDAIEDGGGYLGAVDLLDPVKLLREDKL